MTNRSFRANLRTLIRFLSMILIRFIINVRRRGNIVQIKYTQLIRLIRRVNRHMTFTSLLLIRSFSSITSRISNRFNNIINTIINRRPSISRLTQVNLQVRTISRITSSIHFISHKGRRHMPFIRQHFKRLSQLNRRQSSSTSHLMRRTNTTRGRRRSVGCTRRCRWHRLLLKLSSIPYSYSPSTAYNPTSIYTPSTSTIPHDNLQSAPSGAYFKVTAIYSSSTSPISSSQIVLCTYSYEGHASSKVNAYTLSPYATHNATYEYSLVASTPSADFSFLSKAKSSVDNRSAESCHLI